MSQINEPPKLDIDMNEVLSLIDIVKGEVEPNALGEYPLQKFSNSMYFKLNCVDDFDSKDLAMYLVAQSRKLNIGLFA